MPESTGERCRHCGALLLPRRRFCVACLAQVPDGSRPTEDHLAELMRQIPSTHRPDKTLVFVPELREARLKRERRNRRAVIAAIVSCAILAITAFTIRRVHQRNLTMAAKQQRELMAWRELDLYAAALDSFRTDFGRYPTAKEAHGALYWQPPTLAGWRGPYIEKDYSLDPWGTEYVYRVSNDGTQYELFTYGPEG